MTSIFKANNFIYFYVHFFICLEFLRQGFNNFDKCLRLRFLFGLKDLLCYHVKEYQFRLKNMIFFPESKTLKEKNNNFYHLNENLVELSID